MRRSRQRRLCDCEPGISPYSVSVGTIITHYSYQCLCLYVVEGHGRELGHRAVVKESSDSLAIGFDYAFFSDSKEVKTQEAYKAKGVNAIKLLVVWDDESKSIVGSGQADIPITNPEARARERTREMLYSARPKEAIAPETA